jgi:hypothetical protein
MRQLSSNKNSYLIEAFRGVPVELQRTVSTLITDQIYWQVAGSYKTYSLSSDIKVHYQHVEDQHTIKFKKGDTTLFTTTIKKWPDNWHDEALERDKMKL